MSKTRDKEDRLLVLISTAFACLVTWAFTLVLFFFLFASSACGQELSYLGFEGVKIHNKRDPYFPTYHLLNKESSGPESWNHGVALRANTDLIRNSNGLLYWDQTITGNSTNKQYREVKWDFELGLSIASKYGLFWQHMSRHWLEGGEPQAIDDHETPSTTYPVEDRIGLRFCLYGCEGRR